MVLLFSHIVEFLSEKNIGYCRFFLQLVKKTTPPSFIKVFINFIKDGGVVYDFFGGGIGMNCEYIVLKRFQHIDCFGFGAEVVIVWCIKNYVDSYGIG